MPAQRRRSPLLVALTAATLLLSAMPAAGIQAKSPNHAAPPPKVQSSSDEAKAKIHPKLRKTMAAAPASKDIRFVARIVKGTSLAPYAKKWFARPWVDPLGTTVAVGLARKAGIQKLAGLPGVLEVRLPESLIAPPKPIPSGRPLPARTAPKIVKTGKSPGPAPAGWFHTGAAIHGSQAAWAKGYTGEGVRYMSNDSGADYCHPDLFGTWAYIDDPASPYYGLPEMFDSASSFLAANDYYLGSTLVRDGASDYADTSTKVSFRINQPGTRTASFKPLGAKNQKVYKLPSTSKSGVYHLGSHPDQGLAGNANIISKALFKGGKSAVAGERAGVLVVDEHTKGVYDTVYVDLNYDYDFRNDAPARLTRTFASREAACLDYDHDGLNDISGGLVYFIADGHTAVPTQDWLWGIPGSAYGNGDLVAFHVQDFTGGAGDHGMGTTSVATGQGVVAGSVFFGPSGPPVAGGKGLVVGPGKDVRSTQNGNFYESPFIEDPFVFAALGYDATPGTGDDIQIVSNSWAFSDVDNDGVDVFSRMIDAITVALGPNTTSLFANGNGGPGYGTVAPPKPASGIGVGAADLNDSVGQYFPDITESQIVGGDVTSFSDRGPTPRNIAGTDVTAIGAFGTGDIPLNETLWGAVATAGFSGTSMATPVAAGNLALIYQAWKDRTGSWPTFDQARALLKGSARDVNNDVFSQGAGLVNADRGTDLAAGLAGAYATPADWSAGSYRGTDYPAFVNILGRGDADTQAFTLHNDGSTPVTVNVSPSQLSPIGTKDYSFTTNPVVQDHGAFPVPDYVVRLDPDIPAGTDLIQVRVARPYDQFESDGGFGVWESDIDNWTDRDGDGRFWDDANHNGKVDVGETDTNEIVAFTYHGAASPTLETRVGDPLGRMADGILLSLYHFGAPPEIDTTHFTIQVTYWRHADWDWLHLNKSSVVVPAHGSATFDGTLSVPANAAFGAYEGAIRVADGARIQTIPVTAAVAGEGTSLDIGGTPPAGTIYDNGRVFGLSDAGWRPETGDWRFFWTDLAADDLSPTGQSYLVVDTAWAHAGSDIDTIVLGPKEDCFSNGVDCGGPLTGFPGDPSRYGPYGLETVGRSANTNEGAGFWGFQTSSGGPAERVVAPAREGLHAILLHQVRIDADGVDEPFSGKLGVVALDPGAIVAPPATSPTSVTLTTGVALNGLVADGFGLSPVVSTREPISQDNPDDPSTASFSTTVTIAHGAKLDVSTGNSNSGSDLDLYVYGPDGSLVGGSFSPTDTESVSIAFPVDGTYRIDVHGFSVPGGSDQFDLTIDAVQGTGVSVSGLAGSIPAGGSDAFSVAWSTAGLASGTYHGLVTLGTAEAPGVLQVPMEVTIP